MFGKVVILVVVASMLAAVVVSPAVASSSGVSAKLVKLVKKQGKQIRALKKQMKKVKSGVGTEGVGHQGQNGSDGQPGLKGDAGPQGATGLQGTKGATGSQGVAGPVGAKGDKGATGAVGPQGPAGSAANLTGSQIYNLLTPLSVLPSEAGNPALSSNEFVRTGATGAIPFKVLGLGVTEGSDTFGSDVTSTCPGNSTAIGVSLKSDKTYVGGGQPAVIMPYKLRESSAVGTTNNFSGWHVTTDNNQDIHVKALCLTFKTQG